VTAGLDTRDGVAAADQPTNTPLVEPDHPATRGRQWLGALVSLIAIGGFVWWAAQQDKPTLPTSPEAIAELAAAVAVYALATLVRGWRWHVLLRRSGIEHDVRDAYALVPVGYMGNTILPARGGELLRVVLLGQRSPARKREIGGSIIAERLLDALVLAALFCLLTFVGVAGSPTGTAPAWAGLGGLVLVLAGGAIAYRSRRHPRLAPLAAKIRPVAAASVLLLRPVGAVLALATAGVWLLEGVIFHLVALSLDLDIGILDGLFLVVLSSFFALIPAAPAYAGTFDAAIVFGLKALGITGGAAVSFAILVRAVLFVPITVVGLVLVLVRYGGWRTLRLGRSQAERPEPARLAR
jgi:glycosyltransferase 2 family protein